MGKFKGILDVVTWACDSGGYVFGSYLHEVLISKSCSQFNERKAWYQSDNPVELYFPSCIEFGKFYGQLGVKINLISERSYVWTDFVILNIRFRAMYSKFTNFEMVMHEYRPPMVDADYRYGTISGTDLRCYNRQQEECPAAFVVTVL